MPGRYCFVFLATKSLSAGIDGGVHGPIKGHCQDAVIIAFRSLIATEMPLGADDSLRYGRWVRFLAMTELAAPPSA